MMECKEVMRRLEGLIPPACASDWDNVGLLVGDPKKKVDKILVALDASDQVLDQAEAVGGGYAAHASSPDFFACEKCAGG